MKRLRLLSAVFVLIARMGNINNMKFAAANENHIRSDKRIHPNRRNW